jgi:hypothetical protein
MHAALLIAAGIVAVAAVTVALLMRQAAPQAQLTDAAGSQTRQRA